MEIRLRLLRHRSQENSSSSRSAVTSTFADSATFVIDGSTDPALFMPWELMERLLNSTDRSSAGSEMLRRRYTDDIVASGWSVSSFWSQFDEIAGDYLVTRKEIARFPRHAKDAGPEVTASHARVELEQAFCAARAKALQSAREKFGTAQFDRFLYEAVAPMLIVYSDDPMTAVQLRWIEGGCR